MFRKFDALAAAAGLSLLAACTSVEPSAQTGPNPPSQQWRQLSAVGPDKSCAGTRRAKVTPCPVRLTHRTKHGIVITVKGRGVVDSEIGEINSCYNASNCFNADRVDGSKTEWLITPGQSCGRAIVEFDAMNAHGHRVGYYFLKIDNNVCP